MSQKKYASLLTLQNFLDKLKTIFASMSHNHTMLDITDYKIDTSLSSTSLNPVANSTIDAEFEAISTAMDIMEQEIDNKANITHDHNDIYYTQTELDAALSQKSQVQIVTWEADD